MSYKHHRQCALPSQAWGAFSAHLAEAEPRNAQAVCQSSMVQRPSSARMRAHMAVLTWLCMLQAGSWAVRILTARSQVVNLKVRTMLGCIIFSPRMASRASLLARWASSVDRCSIICKDSPSKL